MTNNSIDSVYEMKLIILGLIKSSPVTLSDLIDSLYIEAMKEPGLVRSDYNQNFEFAFSYDHKVKKNMIRNITSTIVNFVEFAIRNPANRYTLTFMGKNEFVDGLTEVELVSLINSTLNILDMSTNDSTAFKITL